MRSFVLEENESVLLYTTQPRFPNFYKEGKDQSSNPSIATYFQEVSMNQVS